MNKTGLAGLVLAGLAAVAADAAEPSLCTRLADQARHLPASAWAGPDPLSPALQFYRSERPRTLSPVEAALAADPRWRRRVDAAADEVVEVNALPGTPVYLLEHSAGSANCQSPWLVDALPGQPARELVPPFPLEPTALCVTRSAAAARVLGQAALVVGGAVDMVGSGYDYRIAPWTPRGWGPSCRLALRLDSRLRVGPRYCASASPVCDAGQAIAQRLALAYEAARAANRPLDATAFNDGSSPDAAVAAALNPPLAEEGTVGNLNPPFPLFGADASRLDPMLTVFSNAAPRVLAVLADGRWWLAVVGRSGVGWREGDAVLVALFAPPGRAADGVASYQFLSRPSGLRDVTVTAERR